MKKNALSFMFLWLMPILVHAETLFQDDFNRTTGLGANWSYGGGDSSKAYINEKGQLCLDAAGPIYYATPVETGTPWTRQTIEFNLVQPSPSGDIGCYVDFGINSGNPCGFEYIFSYDIWCPIMYLVSSQSGVVGQMSGFPDLRGKNAYIEVVIDTGESGSSTATFKAYTDSSKSTLLATAGPWSIPTPLEGGYVGFSLPNDYWGGLIVDNFKVTQTLVAEKPKFSPAGQYINGPTDITISSGTAGASIYYTLDGSTPTQTSKRYAVPVTVGNGITLKAIAVAQGYETSPVASRTYNIKIPILAWSGIPPSLSTVERFNELKEAGFTHHLQCYATFSDVQTALDSAQKVGIKMLVNLISPTDTFMLTFKNHPALEAYYLSDEPSASQFSDLATQVQAIRYMDGRHWCYINLLPHYAALEQLGMPSYESYVNTFLGTVPIKIFSFDHYPITNNGVRADFYQNLEIVSSATRSAGKPFWGFVLSAAHNGYPVPTLSHLRFQAFSNLAYGAQGIQYFTYWTVSDQFHDAPINMMGEKTATYGLVQSMNQEIQALAGVFHGAKVLSVEHTGTVLPQGTTQYSPVSPIISLNTQGDGAVVSRLINDHTWYLVVVNRDYIHSMGLNVNIDLARGISRVLKDGTSIAIDSGTNQYTMDPADILILKWNAISGDATLDDVVDVGDLGILAANYGKTKETTWAMGDFNGDGSVDVGDLGILAANYGKGASGSDFEADYAAVFGTSDKSDDSSNVTTDYDISNSFCSALGFSLIMGLALMGLIASGLKNYTIE